MASAHLAMLAALAALQGVPPPLPMAPGDAPPMARAAEAGETSPDMAARLAAARRYLEAIAYARTWDHAWAKIAGSADEGPFSDTVAGSAAAGLSAFKAQEPAIEAEVARTLARALTLSELEERIAGARPGAIDRMVGLATRDALEEHLDALRQDAQRRFCLRENRCPPDLVPR